MFHLETTSKSSVEGPSVHDSSGFLQYKYTKSILFLPGSQALRLGAPRVVEKNYTTIKPAPPKGLYLDGKYIFRWSVNHSLGGAGTGKFFATCLPLKGVILPTRFAETRRRRESVRLRRSICRPLSAGPIPTEGPAVIHRFRALLRYSNSNMFFKGFVLDRQELLGKPKAVQCDILHTSRHISIMEAIGSN